MNKPHTALLCLCLIFFIAHSAAAIQSTGTITGRVTDQFGAIIIGAAVTVTDEGSIERKATSDGQGRYTVSGLRPARYSVHVAARGFAAFDQGTVQIVAGQSRSLDVQLAVGLERQEVTVGAREGLSNETGRNASALVLGASELSGLPDDPEDLAAALQALSGSPIGPNGGQILIDGFLNTAEPLPARSSIREVRINQNPFSAENDRIGFGQIQIITQPGAEKLRGQAYFNFNDESLNSRNPFVARRSSFQIRNPGGTLSGPLAPRRASFFFSLDDRETDDIAIINAVVLDENLQVVPFARTVSVPRRQWNTSARFDLQLNKNHTLTARYNYYRNHTENAGAGGITLAERAFSFTLPIHTLQLTETAVVRSRVVNEFRLQYIAEDQIDEPISRQPAINVLGAFASGGSTSGPARNPEGRLTVQDGVLWTAHAQTLRAGARLRRTTITDVSPDDFNGTYTFAGGLAPQLGASGNPLSDQTGQTVLGPVTSIERYRRTLMFQRQGLTPAEIRARGGGATQLIMGAGNPRATAAQVDFGAYFQDDWRVEPNFTLSAGLRYEFQTNISRHLNFAPRLAFAWSPAFMGEPKTSQIKTVIRGGFGVFFDRFNENQVLITNKYIAGDFFRSIVSDASLLDSFPFPPSVETLRGTFASRQAVFTIASDLREPYMLQGAIGVERQLPHQTTFSATYIGARTIHALRARNINAPFTLRDAADVRQAASLSLHVDKLAAGAILSSVRPFGETGEVFQYESSGRLNQNQLMLTVNSRLSRRVSLFANYTLNKALGDTEGVGSFPANSYDLRQEYGRSSFDTRHTFSVGGTFEIPFDLSLSPLAFASSGRPFNITNGSDSNGDALFTDRPAFATDLTRPSVRVTRFGSFDTAPLPGQQIIPRNYARGSDYFVINLNVTRTFVFGSPTLAAQTQRATAGAGGEGRYRLIAGLRVLNLFNHVNVDLPSGNLSSPLFGLSTATAGGFGAVSGGHPAAGNRRIDAQLRLEF